MLVRHWISGIGIPGLPQPVAHQADRSVQASVTENGLRSYTTNESNVILQKQETAITRKLAAEYQSKIQDRERELKAESARKLEAALQAKDTELEVLQNRISTLSETCQNKRAENKSLLAGIDTANGDFQQLRTKLLASQQDLHTCKDDLFRLQPMNQAPDTEISNDFESICHEISSWIDGEISRFEKEHTEANADTISANIFNFRGDRDAAWLTATHPNFGEYLVTFKIHQCLQETMFKDNVYLVGLSQGRKEILQTIESGMKELEPPRDSKSIKKWRSETFTALAALSQYQLKREAQVKEITQQLFGNLKVVFPIISGHQASISGLHEKVMLPAAKLATKLQVSNTIYKARIPGSTYNWRPFNMNHFNEACSFVDVETRKSLKPHSNLLLGCVGDIGDILIPFESGLVRVDDSGRGIFLRPIGYLVRLYPKHTRR